MLRMILNRKLLAFTSATRYQISFYTNLRSMKLLIRCVMFFPSTVNIIHTTWSTYLSSNPISRVLLAAPLHTSYSAIQPGCEYCIEIQFINSISVHWLAFHSYFKYPITSKCYSQLTAYECVHPYRYKSMRIHIHCPESCIKSWQ